MSHSAPCLGHYHPRPALDLGVAFVTVIEPHHHQAKHLFLSRTLNPDACARKSNLESQDLCLQFPEGGRWRWRWCWWRWRGEECSTGPRCAGSVSAGQSDVFLQQSRFLVSLAVRLQNLQRTVTMESFDGWGDRGSSYTEACLLLGGVLRFYCCLVYEPC